MAEIIPFPTHIRNAQVHNIHRELSSHHNEPTFPYGSKLLIDPSIQPHEYDLVAVQIASAKALICGSLVQVEEFTFLVPMNPDLSVFALAPEDRVIGVVVNAEAP